MARKLAPLSLPLLFLSVVINAWPQSLDYRAPLQPVNPGITDAGLSGTVHLIRRGEELQITIEAIGLAPNTMHLQHLHGSRDGMDAECAPVSAGPDKITDLADTRPHSGISLIPLHDDPASLEIEADSYPVSNRAGGYTYTQTVNWDRLRHAVADKYGIDEIDLGRMVVYIHGVPENTRLPKTVQTSAGMPAHATLPVACGQLDIQPAHK